MLRLVPLLAFSAACSGASHESASGPGDRQPNIVVVFVDDMGYGDLGVTGNTDVPTPNIDRLAAQGTRFEQFYVNSPICSPSRVALTTGTYPSRWRIHSYLASREDNRRRGLADWLDPSAPTLPRALQDAGYATGHFGKWHMGGGRDVGDAPLITAYGFDESVTSFEGLGDRYLWPEPDSALNAQSARLGRGEIRWTEKSRMTTHYVDHAIDFMRRQRDQPFYVNLWPNDVHDPFDPPPELAATYDDAARNHYERDFFAVLEALDREIGRLLDEIDRLGLADQTLVLFTGDNGPTDWAYYYREGVAPPGSTGGLRGRKWSLYEGGIRQPLIVRWPGRVAAGRVDGQTVLSAVDLVPTLAGLAGASLPAGHELDGVDLRSAFLRESVPRGEPLFWYYPNDIRPGDTASVTPRFAMREGRWKLLAERDGSAAELYDLVTDPGETTDLAGAEPDRVARMTERLAAWIAGLPLPDGAW